MRPVRVILMIGLFSWALVNMVWAEPAWTRSGNCQGCHNVSQPDLIHVYGEVGYANPNGYGINKVLQVLPGQTKSLTADVTGLVAGDGYGVELTQLRYRGIQIDHALGYDPDCSWADWDGTAGTYSQPADHYHWGSAPESFQYDIAIKNDTPYDYYELVYAVAGKNDAGELFYDEEAFYLQVVSSLNAAPMVELTSPGTSTVFSAGDDIVLSATASDPDGTISKVEFFANDTLLAETTADHNYLWSDVPAGHYLITAITTDNEGMMALSESVSVEVRGTPGDFDGDGDVDQDDFGEFQRCYGGADAPPTSAGCDDMDLDGDTDVDAQDYATFEQCSSGPGITANVNCAE